MDNENQRYRHGPGRPYYSDLNFIRNQQRSHGQPQAAAPIAPNSEVPFHEAPPPRGPPNQYQTQRGPPSSNEGYSQWKEKDGSQTGIPQFSQPPPTLPGFRFTPPSHLPPPHSFGPPMDNFGNPPHGYGQRGVPPTQHGPPQPYGYMQSTTYGQHSESGSSEGPFGQDYQHSQKSNFGQVKDDIQDHQQLLSSYQRSPASSFREGSFLPPPQVFTGEGYQQEGTRSSDGVRRKPDEKESEHQEWVNNWLMKNKIHHRLKQKKPCQTSMTIPDARRLMREALSVTENLQQLDGKLQQNLHSGPDTWMDLTQKVTTLKARLSEIKEKLSQSVIEELSCKMDQITKKRQRLKSKRKRCYREEQKKLKRREEMHQSIDAWREAIIMREEDKKKEKEMKAAADMTLGEVRRKLQEAERAQDLLAALTKLRQLRKSASERKGVSFVSALDVDFEERVKEQNTMLEEQLKIYQAEKVTLEAMLEMEAEENREKELEQKKQKIEELERRKERTIRRILFGKEGQLAEDDPMIPFRQYYDQSRLNFDNLIQIRQEWDLFLVPPQLGGSRLPDGWVVPVEPSSDVWASVLKERQAST